MDDGEWIVVNDFKRSAWTGDLHSTEFTGAMQIAPTHTAFCTPAENGGHAK